MNDFLLDYGWVAGWISVAVVAISAVGVFYESGRKQKEILRNIEILNAWSRFENDSELSDLKQKVNRQIVELYDPKEKRKIGLLFVAAAYICIFVALFCIAVGNNQLAYILAWVALIPMVIGLFFWIWYFLERPKLNSETPKNEDFENCAHKPTRKEDR